MRLDFTKWKKTLIQKYSIPWVSMKISLIFTVTLLSISGFNANEMHLKHVVLVHICRNFGLYLSCIYWLRKNTYDLHLTVNYYLYWYCVSSKSISFLFSFHWLPINWTTNTLLPFALYPTTSHLEDLFRQNLSAKRLALYLFFNA
jgi:hypothetical protein